MAQRRKNLQQRPKGSMQAHYRGMSDEAIRERWLRLRVPVTKALGISAAVTLATYLILHFAYPLHAGESPKVAFLSTQYILTIAFQMSCVFDVCLGLLVTASYVFGHAPKGKPA